MLNTKYLAFIFTFLALRTIEASHFELISDAADIDENWLFLEGLLHGFSAGNEEVEVIQNCLNGTEVENVIHNMTNEYAKISSNRTDVQTFAKNTAPILITVLQNLSSELHACETSDMSCLEFCYEYGSKSEQTITSNIVTCLTDHNERLLQLAKDLDQAIKDYDSNKTKIEDIGYYENSFYYLMITGGSTPSSSANYIRPLIYGLVLLSTIFI